MEKNSVEYIKRMDEVKSIIIAINHDPNKIEEIISTIISQPYSSDKLLETLEILKDIAYTSYVSLLDLSLIIQYLAKELIKIDIDKAEKFFERNIYLTSFLNFNLRTQLIPKSKEMFDEIYPNDFYTLLNLSVDIFEKKPFIVRQLIEALVNYSRKDEAFFESWRESYYKKQYDELMDELDGILSDTNIKIHDCIEKLICHSYSYGNDVKLSALMEVILLKIFFPNSTRGGYTMIPYINAYTDEEKEKIKEMFLKFKIKLLNALIRSYCSEYIKSRENHEEVECIKERLNISLVLLVECYTNVHYDWILDDEFLMGESQFDISSLLDRHGITLENNKPRKC